MRLDLEEDKQDSFEQMCIKAGRVLPSRHTGRRKLGPFDDILEAIRSVPEGMTPEETAKYLAEKSEELTKKLNKTKGK